MPVSLWRCNTRQPTQPSAEMPGHLTVFSMRNALNFMSRYFLIYTLIHILRSTRIMSKMFLTKLLHVRNTAQYTFRKSKTLYLTHHVHTFTATKILRYNSATCPKCCLIYTSTYSEPTGRRSIISVIFITKPWVGSTPFTYPMYYSHNSLEKNLTGWEPGGLFPSSHAELTSYASLLSDQRTLKIRHSTSVSQSEPQHSTTFSYWLSRSGASCPALLRGLSPRNWLHYQLATGADSRGNLFVPQTAKQVVILTSASVFGFVTFQYVYPT